MVAEPLRASSVHAYYGESHVLHGVDCHVSRGEVVTLLGRNGAGRTTTLKTLLGLIASRSGSVVINGRETISLAPHQIAHLGVGYCPEERGIYASLSTEENLLLPPALAPGECRSPRSTPCFPTCRSGAQAAARISPAVSSRCSRWREFCAPAPGFCCSMRFRRGSLRDRADAVANRAQIAGARLHDRHGGAELPFRCPLADRFYIMERGRIVQGFTARELPDKMTLLRQYLGV